MPLFTSEISVENLPLPVDGSAVIQPVSATALPLPTGASTESTLLAIKAKTDNIDVLLSTRTKPADTQNIAGSVSVSNFPATQPVSGTVAVSNFPATQPVTGPLTDTQLRATPVPINGTVTTSPVVSSSSTVVQVVVPANTNTTLKVANGSRKKIILFAPKAIAYVKLGVTASATSFTYCATNANSTLEVDTWTGQIDIFSSVAQTINVTELV